MNGIVFLRIIMKSALKRSFHVYMDLLSELPLIAFPWFIFSTITLVLPVFILIYEMKVTPVSEFDGDYIDANYEPTEEDLAEIIEEITSNPEEPLFDEEEYELSANGVDDFQNYQSNPYGDDEEYDESDPYDSEYDVP